MYIYNQVYPLRMEILLILSRKSYCFPLYNVAVPVDDSFAGYGLFPVIDDRIEKAWFHFHSPKSLFHCNDVWCSFWIRIIILISTHKRKNCEYPFLERFVVNESFTWTMSISFLEIYDGASIISCYPIPCPCSVVYLKMTVYHCSDHNSITDTSIFSN